MVAQENRPLTIGGDLRRLTQDVGDRETILLGQCHVHARHQREVERHVTFVALAALVAAEVGPRILGPLVGLCQQHAVGVALVDHRPDLLEYDMRLGKVLVVGAFALDQIGNGVQAQAVDSHVQPVRHYLEHFIEHLRIVEIEIRLVGIETVPEVGTRHRVPGPVGRFGIEKDDPRAGIFLIAVRPYVEITLGRIGRRATGALEPLVLIRGVVDDQLGDDPQATLMSLFDEALGILEGAVVGTDAGVLGNVIAVIAARRWVERQDPDGVHAQANDVVQFVDQPLKIADSVIVGIEERLDVYLVDDGVLVP